MFLSFLKQNITSSSRSYKVGLCPIGHCQVTHLGHTGCLRATPLVSPNPDRQSTANSSGEEREGLERCAAAEEGGGERELPSNHKLSFFFFFFFLKPIHLRGEWRHQMRVLGEFKRGVDVAYGDWFGVREGTHLLGEHPLHPYDSQLGAWDTFEYPLWVPRVVLEHCCHHFGLGMWVECPGISHRSGKADLSHIPIIYFFIKNYLK
ncbi:hypothetical protein Hanom_Chr09g00830031 [Helianthus anomalus]